MRSFMKSHRRGSSSENTNNQRPTLSISPTKVTANTGTSLNNPLGENNYGTAADPKQVSPVSGKTSRIKNFLKQKVSSTNLSITTNYDNSVSTHSPTHSSPTGPIASHLAAANSTITQSPKLKQKSSFSSLSTLGLSSKKHSKSTGTQFINNSTLLYEGSVYTQSKGSTSSPTIFGTKTHNWSSDEGPRALRINTEFANSKNSLGGIHEESCSRLNTPLEFSFASHEEEDEDGRTSSDSLSSSKKSEEPTSPSSASASKVGRLSSIVNETQSLEESDSLVSSDLDFNDPNNELDNFSIKVLSIANRKSKANDGKDTLDHDQDKDEGNASIHSGASSQFSFQTNNRAGRNASIKYYKSKDQMNLEQSHMHDMEIHKRFIEETGAEDYELQEDMNYVDFNEHDETEELFNRKLFSSDEEGEDEVEEANRDADEYLSSQQYEDDQLDDDYSDDLEENPIDSHIDSNTVRVKQVEEIHITEVAPTHTSFNSGVDSYPDDLSTKQADKISEEKDESHSPPSDLTGTSNAPSDLVRLLMKLQSSEDTTPPAINVASRETSPTVVGSGSNSIITQTEPAIIYNAPENSTSLNTQVPVATKRDKHLTPRNTRKPSIKYHEVDGNIDDDLEFLEKRYSWFPDENDDENIESGKDSLTSVIGDYFSHDPSPSDEYKGFDDSLIDEINQLPEDYDFESDEKLPSISVEESAALSPRGSFRSRHSLRSLKSASSHKPLLRATSSGNRIEMSDKTITLFKPISRNSSMRSNISSYSENATPENGTMRERLVNSGSHKRHPYESLSYMESFKETTVPESKDASTAKNISDARHLGGPLISKDLQSETGNSRINSSTIVKSNSIDVLLTTITEISHLGGESNNQV